MEVYINGQGSIANTDLYIQSKVNHS